MAMNPMHNTALDPIEGAIFMRNLKKGNSSYRFYVLKDYTIAFQNLRPGLDEAGFEKTGFDLLKSGDNFFWLFRKMEESISEFFWEFKPPFVQFSVAREEKRIQLYTLMAKKWARNLDLNFATSQGYFLLVKKLKN